MRDLRPAQAGIVLDWKHARSQGSPDARSNQDKASVPFVPGVAVMVVFYPRNHDAVTKTTTSQKTAPTRTFKSVNNQVLVMFSFD